MKAASLGGLLLAVCVWGAQPAHAGFVLELDAGSGPVTVTDGGAGDSNAAAGIITFSGSIAGFSISITTGISKPVTGSFTQAALDLNSLQITGGGPGTLTIRLTDTDFTHASVDLATSSIGGVTDGSVSVKTYLDRDNTEFGTGELLSDLGLFGPGSFSATDAVQLAPPVNPLGVAPFSLTVEATIVHAAVWQVTSFDAAIVTDDIVGDVPAPTTILVLLPGLLGLSALRRRLRRS